MEDVISGRSYFLFRNGLRGNIFEAGHSVCAYARGWALLVRFDSIDRWIGTISRLEDTHTLVCTCIYTYWTVGKRRKRQIVEMEEGQAAGTVPFVRVVLARSVRQDESLWDYSMTRVLEDGPCLADPTSSRRSLGTTRGYIPVSRSVYEPFETFVYGTGPKSSRSKLEIFFRPAKRGFEELVLERLVKYCNHTPS